MVGLTLCSALPDIREPLWLLQTRENPQENVEPGKHAAFKGQPIFLVQEVCSVRNTNRKDRKAQVNPHHCVELLRASRTVLKWNNSDVLRIRNNSDQGKMSYS